MTMKQTQTKLFDFSDVGLDFCAGSKNLFPNRFKKMLALGYNTQTVSNVTVAGNQVTLNYGMSHGYTADRVLKLNTPELAGINNGEFVIDSVTTQTVTLTIDNAPQSIAGNFTTYIAPLGWDLVYEQDNIQVYKMLHLDDSSRYVRLCYQNVLNYRNRIAVCVGKSYNAVTGFIDDPYSLEATRQVMTPNIVGLPSFDSYEATARYNNYTYSEGYAEFGVAYMVGSPYHFLLSACHGSRLFDVWAILPTSITSWDHLAYPIVFCRASTQAVSAPNDSDYSLMYASGEGYPYVGKIRCRFDRATAVNPNTAIMASYRSAVAKSAVSDVIEPYITTMCEPFKIYENATSQFLGYVYGTYQPYYANDVNHPVLTKPANPKLVSDIDLDTKGVLIGHGFTLTKENAVFNLTPVEEIKIV